MKLITLVIYLVIIGTLAWVTMTYFTIPKLFKTLIYAVLAIAAVMLCLAAFGILEEMKNIPVPKVN